MVVEWPLDTFAKKQEWALWKPISDRLRSSFEAQPIEDCVSHPAEQIVQGEAADLSKIQPELLVGWLVEEGGEFAASVITSLGRCDVPISGFARPVGADYKQWNMLPSHMAVGDDHEDALQPTQAFDPVSWRLVFIGAALESTDVRVRDSAVQAVENWSSEALLAAFESHDEPERWLRDYIAGVREDLSK